MAPEWPRVGRTMAAPGPTNPEYTPEDQRRDAAHAEKIDKARSSRSSATEAAIYGHLAKYWPDLNDKEKDAAKKLGFDEAFPHGEGGDSWWGSQKGWWDLTEEERE